MNIEDDPIPKGISISLFFQSLGVSIINSKPAEICYIQASEIFITHKRSAADYQLSVKVDQFQIDNQLTEDETDIVLRKERGKK
jgi:hypothetical protein